MKKIVFLNNPPTKKVVTYLPMFLLVFVSPLHWPYVRNILFFLKVVQEGCGGIMIVPVWDTTGHGCSEGTGGGNWFRSSLVGLGLRVPPPVTNAGGVGHSNVLRIVVLGGVALGGITRLGGVRIGIAGDFEPCLCPWPPDLRPPW